jgi:tetratricopeptide (TPR) repeat protein
VVEIALIAEAARLSSEGRLEEAVSAYQRLLARSPDLPDSWYNLGLLLRRLGHFDAALECYAQALRRGVQRPEEVHLNRGVIFSDCLRQDDAAERELRRALELNPNYQPALLNLANLHEDLGRRDEAGRAYERLLELEPRAFEALARYSLLFDIDEPAHPLIGRLRAGLADPAATGAEQASLGFALARALDASGQCAEAFAAADAANRASRLTTAARYDRAAHERFIDAVIAAFPRPREGAAAQGGSEAAAMPPCPRPIFICGMFRSGSTLTERLLAGNGQVTPGGELDLLPRLVQAELAPFPAAVPGASPALLASLAARYRSGLARLFPHADRVTDKWLGNYLHLGLIKALFPEARIVHTTRDPLDTCLSIFFLHLDPRMPWALDLMDIGHYFRQYRRLMAHWHSLYADILEFNYDRLVADPRPAAQRLLAFCGLDWNEACLEFAQRAGSVRTASVWQVRQGLYLRSSGRARHYARELETLTSYLAEP